MNMAALTGNVFNIQRYSVQDGPGIRTTVFMKGCPLACAWCSNPESKENNRQLAYRATLCNDCGKCVEKCEKGAISIAENGISIDRDTCDDCFECVDICAPEALKVIGTNYTVDEVFQIVKKDILYYRNSKGGVTASGGEPLSQADFVAELFKRCQYLGIHTTLDTSGSGSASALEKVLPYTDLLLFDIKIINPELHKKFIYSPNQRILKNIVTVKESGVPFIVRVPLIPGITDTDNNIDDIAQFVSDRLGGAPINVLPYHRFGTNKYNMIDEDYEIEGMEPMLESRVKEVVQRFEQHGLDCSVVT